MQITRTSLPGGLKLTATGRLDAHWSDHLGRELDAVIRDGNHQLLLDVNGIEYISSAGLRVLLQYYRKLQELDGSLVIVKPTAAVRKVIDLAGFTKLLRETEGPAHVDRMDRLAAAPDRYQFHELDSAAAISVRRVGNPAQLTSTGYAASDALSVTIDTDSFALGLGALGEAATTAAPGEFLALAGAAAYLPTDGSNAPDYIYRSADLVPTVTVDYGLVGRGAFRQQIRFEPDNEHERVALSELLTVSLDRCGSDMAAVAIVAETAGLVGAALRRPPAAGSGAEEIFTFPAIRDWLSYTSERAYAGSLAIIAGVVTRGNDNELAPLARQLDSGGRLHGHLHAAVFSYRSLRQGKLDLAETVNGIFHTEKLQGVLHLLRDDRVVSGVGESEFIRGAAWCSPLRNSAAGAGS